MLPWIALRKTEWVGGEGPGPRARPPKSAACAPPARRRAPPLPARGGPARRPPSPPPPRRARPPAWERGEGAQRAGGLGALKDAALKRTLGAPRLEGLGGGGGAWRIARVWMRRMSHRPARSGNVTCRAREGARHSPDAGPSTKSSGPPRDASRAAVGHVTRSWTSRRPGRSSASSSSSGRLVNPTTMKFSACRAATPTARPPQPTRSPPPGVGRFGRRLTGWLRGSAADKGRPQRGENGSKGAWRAWFTPSILASSWLTTYNGSKG
jgi:hypothetical protein